MIRHQCGVTLKPSKCTGNMNSNKCGHIQTQLDTSHPSVFAKQCSNQTAHTDTAGHKSSQCAHKTVLKPNGTHRHNRTQVIPMCSQNSARTKRHTETQPDTSHPNVLTKQRSNQTAHRDTTRHKSSQCVYKTVLEPNGT